ncbi:MAG: substrate-binding domain-containing protein [Flavobacteriales bacterium]|nr:substrate-binding domain-containing protein [Flavobacteriales bacterium]
MIRVGGVPEHFNLPWHLAMENGHFRKEGLEVTWRDFPGGTGAMTKALRANEVDICVLLTEGIVSDIINGNPSKIVSKYINTPLIWGVHTSTNNDIEYYGEIYDKQYAISRFGSGSHLMAIVDAFDKGIELKSDQFTVIKNLDGARNSLMTCHSDVFYWEKYTTKSYVDSGEMKRLGEYITPWPCFVIAATNDFIQNHSEDLNKLLKILFFNCDHFMQAPNVLDLVSERYGLLPEDADRWFHSTEWATHPYLSKQMIKSVQFALENAGIIENRINYERLVFTPNP